jgi:hypothetical protein
MASRLIALSPARILSVLVVDDEPNAHGGTVNAAPGLTLGRPARSFARPHADR